MKQLILTADKQQDNSTVYTLIEIEQNENSYVRFPWNAQSINQTVLDLLIKAIAEELGATPKPIDLIVLGEKIAQEQGIEFQKLNVEGNN